MSAGTASLDENGGARRVTSDKTQDLQDSIVFGTGKNVILLIGDGMGDSEITVARDYAEGAAGRFAGIDALPITGQYTTYSVKKGTDDPDYVPDSAATGTAWATGTKTYDNAISVDTNGAPQKSLLELAKAKGLKTGNVTTSELQDATPAVQAAHISQRACYAPSGAKNMDLGGCVAEKKETGGLGSITEQIIDTRADVTLGGGKTYFGATAVADNPDSKTLLAQAVDKGYQVVETKDALAALTTADQSKPVLGLFAAGNLPVRYVGPAATVGGADLAAVACTDNTARPATQPKLADMTTKAIELLENDKGFFLQVEGASIDKQDHSADACGQIGETVDLDEAVQVALTYAKEQGDTTVIVTADHAHTSQIVDSAPPGLSTSLLTADGQTLKISYGTSNTPGGQQHTGSQLRVAAYGPGAANFSGLTDQTDMFFTIRNVLSLEGAQELDVPNPTPTVTASPEPAPTVTVTAAPQPVPTVTVTAAPEPSTLAASAVPVITGSVRVGSTLTATAGTWNVAGTTAAYQWLRDGKAISGATKATYKVSTADAGAGLAVRVTATKGVLSGVAYSAGTSAVPRVDATIKTSVKKTKLTVKVSGVPAATGRVSIYEGSKVIARNVALKSGSATVSLSSLKSGTHTLKVVFEGSSQLLPETVNAKVKVRR
jgi:alkaline phosphatase